MAETTNQITKIYELRTIGYESTLAEFNNLHAALEKVSQVKRDLNKKTISTLLGHLGSFAHRKADAIISVTKSKDQNISVVEPVDCREKEFSAFAFSVDQKGMPYILPDYDFEKKAKLTKETSEPPKGTPPHNIEKNIHDKILNKVFAIEKELGYADFWRTIKNTVAEITGGAIGDNKAKEFVLFYMSEGNVLRIEISKKKFVYVLPGQRELLL